MKKKLQGKGDLNQRPRFSFVINHGETSLWSFLKLKTVRVVSRFK